MDRALKIPSHYSRTLLRRGVFIWAAARAGVVMLAMFAAQMSQTDMVGAGDLLRGPNLIVSAWTLVLSAILILVDLWRRHEVMLLNNLGVTTPSLVMLGAVPAAVIEGSLLLVLR